MGGVYFLLKLRDSKPSEHAGKIKLRNILIYTVLATWLRLACGFCLNQVAFFQVGILVEGFFFTYPPMSFSLRFFSSFDTLGNLAYYDWIWSCRTSAFAFHKIILAFFGHRFSNDTTILLLHLGIFSKIGSQVRGYFRKSWSTETWEFLLKLTSKHEIKEFINI